VSRQWADSLAAASALESVALRRGIDIARYCEKKRGYHYTFTQPGEFRGLA
jgi:hypothetical protein